MEAAEEKAAQEAGGQEYAKFLKAKKERTKKSKKPRKGKKQDDNPFETSPSSAHSRSSSLSLSASYSCCKQRLVNK